MTIQVQVFPVLYVWSGQCEVDESTSYESGQACVSILELLYIVLLLFHTLNLSKSALGVKYKSVEIFLSL